MLLLAAPTAAAALTATAAAMAMRATPRGPKALSPRVKASDQLLQLPHAS